MTQVVELPLPAERSAENRLIGGVCLLRGLDQDPSGLLAGAEVVIPIATIATYAHLGWATFRRPAGAVGAG